MQLQEPRVLIWQATLMRMGGRITGLQLQTQLQSMV